MLSYITRWFTRTKPGYLGYTQCCSPRGRCLVSRLPQDRTFWCLGLMPAASVFHWLVSALEKLPLPRLDLDLTASVSPWLVWLTGKPHKTQIFVMG